MLDGFAQHPEQYVGLTTKPGYLVLKNSSASNAKAQRSPGAQKIAPAKIDWSGAKNEKWQFDAITGPGSFTYKTKPKINKRQGSISEGINRVKKNPQLYEGVHFQTEMKNWPVDQQSYDLILRSGSGYRFLAGQSPNFTFIQAKYFALTPYDEIRMTPDDYTDSMSYKGHKCGKPLHPGRGQGLCDVPHIQLIGDVHPEDIAQGHVGDCWLLCAMSALSEFHGAVQKLLQRTPYFKSLPANKPQTYTVTLYDLESWHPVDIEVDERLCTLPDSSGILGCFPCLHGELWPCYVEKAVAIHCGGWDQIEGGQPTHAWRLLTGCRYQYTFTNSGQGFECFGTFNPNTNEWDSMSNSPHGTKGVWPMKWPEVGGGGELGLKCQQDEMFQKMCAWDAASYMMALGTRSGSNSSSVNGIIDGHAYTLITCLNNVAGSGHDLVKLRNPWGEGECTSSMWTDDGCGWEQFPEVKEVCDPVKANDGVFWLSSDEMFKYFPTIYLCAMNMSEFVQ
ncbi:unnamed protein product [Cladocopium goreaui]|uniref:Calpain-5 (New calpain 3) (NCL-3) n=1 Tax=Cladocopium goreaui TaxID=2562237 RepID=A0A9P1GG17_9DINO|nr:unnamed protein product [Cladocopium goreaui]